MTTTISRAATRRRLQRASLLLVMLAAIALPVQALASAQVPLKGSDAGTWGQGGHDCGSLFPVSVDGAGHASAIGRYAYASRECVDFGQTPFPYQGSFTMTTGNGDTLVGTYVGTASIDSDGVTILYHQAAIVTGGTGRFADATGSFDVSGVANPDGSYVQELNGKISGAGRSKR